MSGDDVLMMPAVHRVEVFTGTSRRRRWSREQKAEIVAESYATTTGEAAARFGVSKTQLFTWRREARATLPRVEFAKVEIEADRVDQDPGFGVIELASTAASCGLIPALMRGWRRRSSWR